MRRGKFAWGRTMHLENERFARGNKGRAAGMALALLLTGSGIARLQGQSGTATANAEKKTMTTASKFYCNIKTFNPAERSRHTQVTEKLIAARENILHTDKRYEFHNMPSK